MALYIGKNHKKNAPVQSIFRLAGNDEDALTYALGYLLAHDYSLCAKLVRYLRVALRRPLKPDYSVFLQEVTGAGFGRRDIVIEDERLRIVLEAKIGRAEPTTQQLTKYAEEYRLWSMYATKAVVALTQGGLSAKTKSEVKEALAPREIKFKNLQWHEIVELVLSHSPSRGTEISRYLFNQFISYVRRDYKMDYHDAEILIQDLDPLNVEIFEEGWMYVTNSRDKNAPLYFAPYYTNATETPGLSKISRVIHTEFNVLANVESVPNDPSEVRRNKWSIGLEKIIARAKNKGFYESWSRLLYMAEPLTLWDPPLTKVEMSDLGVTNGTLSQIPKGYSLRFDAILAHVRR